MIKIAVTGGYATGKTTVLDMLSELGAYCVSADKIVHHLLANNKEVQNSLIEYFGVDILDSRKIIDRERLGEIVFSDGLKRKKINEIIHPYVKREIKELITKKINNGTKILAVEMPLLYEAGMESDYDKVIVVNCARKVQQKRAEERLDIRKEEITKRIEAQMNTNEKAAKADYVIDNNGSTENTKNQLNEFINKLNIKKEEL